MNGKKHKRDTGKKKTAVLLLNLLKKGVERNFLYKNINN
jgi:hypothetical protein